MYFRSKHVFSGIDELRVYMAEMFAKVQREAQWDKGLKTMGIVNNGMCCCVNVYQERKAVCAGLTKELRLWT